MEQTERYSRQIALFGAEGQEKITACRVGIAGLGGLGSHIAQQLAYLGTEQFVLIDDDVVSNSNLNRLVGATHADLGEAKVEVAKSLIEGIQPQAVVEAIAKQLGTQPADRSLVEVDVIFGCFDGDMPRMHLTEHCSRHGIPYLDLATDVAPDGSTYGGRLVFAINGDGCLACLDEIDQHELARAQMTPEQRRADDKIYGVDREALGETGPSVVSLNGAVASLAVTEFMAWATGLRDPIRLLDYRGDKATVRPSRDEPKSGCYYCEVLWPASATPDPAA